MFEETAVFLPHPNLQNARASINIRKGRNTKVTILRSSAQIDMTFSNESPELEITVSNSSTITLTNGYYTETYRGSFQYDFSGNVYGALDSGTASAGGQLLLSLTDINRDARIISDLIYSNDPLGTYSYIFSGDDRIVTSTFDDYLRGFTGNDYINGSGGNDLLFGEQGLDRLYGGNGADRLNGGTGGDLMSGGMGNDRYYSDNPNDRIVEAANQGIETIYASASRGMAANVEKLTLIGEATWGVGNGLANVIRANGLGNALVGGAGDDWIFGGNGNDRITGSTGIDHMVGGGGFDMFVFTDAAGQDIVHAFQRGVDRLNLSAIDADAVALGDQAFSYIASAGFSGTTAGELRYDGATLSGDVNGDGQADFEIEIANHVALTPGDLLL